MAELQNKIVIDATNSILGRLASYAAKQAMLGKSIVIVNCDNIVVSGKSRSIINEYKVIRSKGGSSGHGPFFPKSPERILKRTIRGMLSYKQARGKDAMKRIMCHNSEPEEFKNMQKIKSGKEKNMKTITLKKLSQEI